MAQPLTPPTPADGQIMVYDVANGGVIASLATVDVSGNAVFTSVTGSVTLVSPLLGLTRSWHCGGHAGLRHDACGPRVRNSGFWCTYQLHGPSIRKYSGWYYGLGHGACGTSVRDSRFRNSDQLHIPDIESEHHRYSRRLNRNPCHYCWGNYGNHRDWVVHGAGSDRYIYRRAQCGYYQVRSELLRFSHGVQ